MCSCDLNVLPVIYIIFLLKELDRYKLEISFYIIIFADKLVMQNVLLHIDVLLHRSVFFLWYQARIFLF